MSRLMTTAVLLLISGIAASPLACTAPLAREKGPAENASVSREPSSDAARTSTGVTTNVKSESLTPSKSWNPPSSPAAGLGGVPGGPFGLKYAWFILYNLKGSAKSNVSIVFAREEDPEHDSRELILYDVPGTSDIEAYEKLSENYYSPYVLGVPEDWRIVSSRTLTNSASTLDTDVSGITRLVVFVLGLSTRYFPVKQFVYSWVD
jgi:hypothetical protein